MEDLGRDELIQLITFYKQRASDLEFTVLQTQLKLNKTTALVGQDQPVPASKTVVDRKPKSE
jgi:hypothetical protein